MISENNINKLKKKHTPFFVYDLSLLQKTITSLKKHAGNDYKIHYALKANPNPKLLELIQQAGLGADCVSGNEIKQSIKSGFKTSDIVFAGVGKSDQEIDYALEQNIFCFK